jgi:hypothetical protein
MTDWKKIAAGVSPEIEVDKILPVMEALERAFDPLVESIPAGSDIWTGPEDVA